MEINLFESGKRIKEIRMKHHYSMNEFARILDSKSTSSVNDWEKGRNLPNKQRLEKIALLGNTTVEWIKYGDFSDYVYRLTQNIEEKILKEYGETTLNNYREALLDKLMIEKVTYEEDTKILSITEKVYFMILELQGKPNPKKTYELYFQSKQENELKEEISKLKEKIKHYESVFDGIESLLNSLKNS